MSCSEDSISKSKGLHYNFVFFFIRDDYWLVKIGNEVINSNYVHAYRMTFDGHPFLQKLFRLHWSYRINKRVNLPFKSIWFKRMYEQSFSNNLPLCFIYMGGNSIYADGGFTNYVRKRNPDNRQVIIHGDLISKKIDYDYSVIKNKVDLAVTYDREEANKYGIHYFREDTYSMPVPLPDKTNINYESDVYFLGAAKDRLEKIIKIHHLLTANGLKCLFLIADAPKELRVDGDGIIYTNGISYRENVLHVIRTKCVLEIIQEGSSDMTTRAMEAIAYRRRLITNESKIPKEIFNPGQLCQFEDPERLDIEFIKKDYDQNEWIPKIDMNPLKRLYDIQDQLEQAT